MPKKNFKTINDHATNLQFGTQPNFNFAKFKMNNKNCLNQVLNLHDMVHVSNSQGRNLGRLVTPARTSGLSSQRFWREQYRYLY